MSGSINVDARGEMKNGTERNMNMRTNGSWALLSLLPVMLLQGCMDGFEPSLLESPRVLALRASPVTDDATGQSYRLQALAHGVDDLEWTACLSPWIPTETGVECPSITLDLSRGDAPLSASLELSTYPIPDPYRELLTTVYVLAEPKDPDVPPAVLTVDLISGPSNPPLDGITLDGANAANWSPGDDGTVEVTPVWSGELGGAGTTTSFYTTRGAFNPWRVLDGGPSVLTLEDGDGPTILYVVTRYLGEGTSWIRLEVNP
jgi:hypothetical protein